MYLRIQTVRVSIKNDIDASASSGCDDAVLTAKIDSHDAAHRDQEMAARHAYRTSDRSPCVSKTRDEGCPKGEGYVTVTETLPNKVDNLVKNVSIYIYIYKVLYACAKVGRQACMAS